MKIYTRTGDKGITTLANGKKVVKSDLLIEAYGTVDELIAYVGLLRDQDIQADIKNMLIMIQDKLMICAAILASAGEKESAAKLSITDEDIKALENAIDLMENELPALTSFVLPGGHSISSMAHITRTVCRRAERRIVEVTLKHFVPDNVLQYINRLSDYFFVLSRKLLIDNQGIELKWNKRL
jgi:cob(I)alamin adenosyltransferase